MMLRGLKNVLGCVQVIDFLGHVHFFFIQTVGKKNLCMKVKFVLCPHIPQALTQESYFDPSECDFRCKHDYRSLASERFALAYLGIERILLGEDALIDRYASLGLKVPEVIAIDPNHADRVISVEVKRICGNQLPLDHTNQVRRKLKRGNHYIWPWQTTIYNSVQKAHPKLVSDLKIHVHHIVFVVPLSLDRRSLQRMCDRICAACHKEASGVEYLNHITIHIIQGQDSLFDRF
jgi:hypothetical protein